MFGQSRSGTKDLYELLRSLAHAFGKVVGDVSEYDGHDGRQEQDVATEQLQGADGERVQVAGTTRVEDGVALFASVQTLFACDCLRAIFMRST